MNCKFYAKFYGTHFAFLKKILHGDKMNQLEILKKHLGNVEGKGAFEARTISTQIADANDFIAILQSVESVLKKLSANLQGINLSENPASNLTNNKANLDAQIEQSRALVTNASFLGEKLFGVKFSANVSGQSMEFKIADPFFALENGGIDGVLAYIEDKRDEISTLFDALDAALSIDNALQMPTNLGFDYKDIFAKH